MKLNPLTWSFRRQFLFGFLVCRGAARLCGLCPVRPAIRALPAVHLPANGHGRGRSRRAAGGHCIPRAPAPAGRSMACWPSSPPESGQALPAGMSGSSTCRPIRCPLAGLDCPTWSSPCPATGCVQESAAGLGRMRRGQLDLARFFHAGVDAALLRAAGPWRPECGLPFSVEPALHLRFATPNEPVR